MNEEDTIQNEEQKESDEDDNEEYFLQSTPGAYDIREKIREANDELFEDYELYNFVRELRVTFRENLVDYEPDYSSDDGYVQSPDVLSVISDHEDEEEIDKKEDIITYEEVQEDNIQIIDETNKIEEFDYELLEEENIIEEPENNFEEIVEECEEEIEKYFEEEEIEKDIEEEEIEKDIEEEKIEKFIEEEIEDSDDPIVEVVEIIQDITDEETISSSQSSEDVPIHTREEIEETIYPKKKTEYKIEKVNCRLHCLEKKELDFILGKTKNYDEYLKGPCLKLRQKPCCTNQPFKPKLPTYNGFMSEYGLTKTQLEKRQKRKEKHMQKKKEKSVRIKEEKKQKDLYNEEIFCAWLKSLKNRGQINKENTIKKGVRQRPKTAPHCNLSLAIKIPKRPNTSPGCSYKIIFE